jgi:hypothetical protein
MRAGNTQIFALDAHGGRCYNGSRNADEGDAMANTPEAGTSAAPPEPLLSLSKLAAQLRTSPSTIDRLTDEGMPVAATTSAGRPLYLRSQVDEYMAERARIAARRGAS